MRFPWQKRKVEQPTDFPLKLNTDNLNWCRDARLLLIEGNGTLKWESRGRNEDWSQQYALTLRGTPLIVHNAPDCPTCAGLLATGYGLDKADAPELQQISDVINAPYVDLDTSIASMAPLLGASVLRSLCNCRRRQLPCRWKWELFLGCSRRIFQCRGYRTSLVQ